MATEVTSQDLLVIQKAAKRVFEQHIDKKYYNVKPWTPAICQQFATLSLDDLLFKDYFLNLDKNLLYPLVLDTLYEVWDSWESGEKLWYLVLLCAIGSGKTELNAIMQWLQWYRLTTRFFDFRKKLKLMPNATTCLIQMNRDAKRAKEVTFSRIYPLFQCPFNRDYFPPDTRTASKIKIVRNNTAIFPGSGGAASGLGYDIYAAGLDEMTALKIVDKSVLGDTGGGKYDVAQVMFDEVDKRMDSRFAEDRGTLVMFSQRRTGKEFIENFARQIENGTVKNGLVKKYSFWEAVGWRNRKFYKDDNVFYFNKKTFSIVIDSAEVELLTKRKQELKYGKLGKGMHTLQN